MIELLEHNKETYLKLCKTLETNNKCALIQATGTGKSYIAGKYIEEHVKTALILVPTNAIADAWNELLNGIEQEINIITYQAFAKEPDNYLDYDLVIADEMHHLGSDVWGKKFIETYLQSENHKIIGLTATEVRYLDDSRDMAEEIFENIRVDGCDLPTAINTGILPTFKYVSALYCNESDFDEWKEKAGKIKDIKTQAELNGRLDVCIKNMVSVKQAVHENLSDNYKKIIVFLNNVESKENALEMFKDVFPTANFYGVDYSKYRTENNSQIEKFKVDDNRAVLFAVDMLNEGVHIKGTDCIIMFRKTVSPQVYLQQLGRGLSSDTNKMPIIFDFVSNIKNISFKLKNESEEDSGIIKTWNKEISKENQIILKSYASEIQYIIRKISEFTRRKEWKKEEIEFVKLHGKDMKYEEIAKILGISKRRVDSIAQWLCINKNNHISEKTKEYIKMNYGKIETSEISKYLGISEKYIVSIACRIGCSDSKKKYSKKDEEFIKNNYKIMGAKEIAKILGRTEQSVMTKASKLEISKKIPYSKEEDEFILNHYQTMTYKDIAEKLQRSYKGVEKRARILGIAKYNAERLTYETN